MLFQYVVGVFMGPIDHKKSSTESIPPQLSCRDHPMLDEGLGFQFKIGLFGFLMVLIPIPATSIVGALALVLAIYLYEVERREWHRIMKTQGLNPGSKSEPQETHKY